MTEKEREELIEKMAFVMFEYAEEQSRLRFRDVARAALAVAEPVIREQADDALREENARLREALKQCEQALQAESTYHADERLLYLIDGDKANAACAAAAAIQERGKE